MVQKLWVCCVVPCSVVLAGTHGVYVVFVSFVNHNLYVACLVVFAATKLWLDRVVACLAVQRGADRLI